MLLSWGQCCISITDEVMSDLSDLFYWTHLVCYPTSVLSDTYILLSSSSAPVHARACAHAACADDDDDEIILCILRWWL